MSSLYASSNNVSLSAPIGAEGDYFWGYSDSAVYTAATYTGVTVSYAGYTLAGATQGITANLAANKSYTYPATNGTNYTNGGQVSRVGVDSNSNTITYIDLLYNISGIIGTSLADSLIGNTDANRLEGGSGADTLDGGSGADTLIGGEGDDVYVVDNTADVVSDAISGNNVISSSVSYTLVTNVTNLVLTGTAAISGTGTASSEIITGNDAANVLSDGGAGTDTLIGAGGNDTYIISNTSDIISDTAGTADTVSLSVSTSYDLAVTGIERLVLDSTVTSVALITVNDSVGQGVYVLGNSNANKITGSSYNDTIDGGTGNDSLTGGSGNDSLIGGAGNDTLAGDAGNDTLAGGAGDDVYTVDSTNDTLSELANQGTDVVSSSVNYTLGTNLENLTATGTNGLTLVGNVVANSITGGTGNDTIDGGSGVDSLNGGNGDNVYIVDTTTDSISGGSGTDTISSSVNFSLSSSLVTNIENLTLTGTAITAIGSTSSNIITGNASNNVFSDGGSSSADTFIGGAGNDTYIVSHTSDSITDSAGTDTVSLASSVSQYTLNATGIEVLNIGSTATNTVAISSSVTTGVTVIGNSGTDSMTGGSGNDTLNGGSGDDSLDGKSGADVLIGGAGNDTYTIDSSSDVISEAGASDTDTVTSSVNFTLSANLENLSAASGATGLTLVGNTLANSITGGSGNDTLNDGGDTVSDTLNGGDGNDTYIISSTHDVVSEANATGGTDTISLGSSIANYTLTTSGIEILNIGNTGGATVTVSGSITSTVSVIGNVGNDSLTGTSGASDYLSGGDGNDTLNGSTGADTLVGGAGNDTYIIDSSSDVISETANNGSSDTVSVMGTFAYTLGANLENLVGLSGAISLTGNSLNNSITGNTGNDTIDGGIGTDTMAGAGGNDTYTVDNAGDVVSENAAEGTADVVNSSVNYTLGANVESLVLTTAAVSGTGNTDANTITGGSNDNVLDGGAGADTYIDAAGNDTYTIDNASDVISDSAGTSDSVITKLEDYTLSFIAVENLILADGIIKATGSSAANLITGNSLANVLNDGGSNADTLVGGDGNDTYGVNTSADVISETATGGTDTVSSSVNYNLSLAANVENLTLTGSVAVSATGNSTANIISGNTIANVLDGGAADAVVDTLIGDAGNDTYLIDSTIDIISEITGGGTADVVSSSVSYTLVDQVENLTLTGSNAINGTGNSLANTVVGNSLANVLDGGSGVDNLQGGSGNDTYIVDSTTDTISDSGSDTADVVQSSVSFTLGANVTGVENLSLTGTAVSGTGNTAANVITGNDAANVLDGGSGIDTLVGGLGDDTYAVDTSTDVISEIATGGTDTILSSISYTLSTANVENLTLSVTTGTSGLVGVGSAAANVVTGSANADTLDGGAGVDTLVGGLGNDVYTVDTTTDTISEATNGGTADTISSSVNYSLSIANNVENLVLGVNATTGVGNASDNTITGNTRANILDGGAGADTLIGAEGNDTYFIDTTNDVVSELASGGTDLVSSAVNYTLADQVENLILSSTNAVSGTGNSLANSITGNSANNVLDGGIGADTLVGAEGNDTYMVDNTGDKVTEALSGTAGGTDIISSSVSYNLSGTANVENLTLVGTSAIDGTGNTLNNVITGNDAVNVLTGGAGTDTLIGGGGNDTYVVDSTTDTLSEVAGESTADLVSSSVNFTLSATQDLENLTLTSTAVSGTGNSLENVITGNSVANVLDGGSVGGADTLIGGAGNDTYVVYDDQDVVSEAASAGTDTIQTAVSFTLNSANVENLTLTGTATVDATGDSNANVITGNSADNTLDGGAGADTLVGGLGNDTYVVDSSADVVSELASGGSDTVLVSTSYTLALPNIENLALDNVTTALNGVGNSDNNVITGNDSNNVLDGGAGVDTLIGGAGDDTYAVDSSADVVSELADEGTDTVNANANYTLNLANVENLSLTPSTGSTSGLVGTGSSGNNLITGSSNADTISGGLGVDTLIGGFGNDTYIVDTTTDVISEGASTNAGTADTISTSVNYTLATDGNVENLVLSGTTAVSIVGNSLNNLLQGNSLNNVLDGGLGADTLIGGYGVTTVNGIETDIDGADTYIVDNTGDVISESGKNTYAVDPATDLISAINPDIVSSSVSYTLKSNLENLVLASGTAALNGTGNNQANVLTGNDGNNVLDGKGGNDVMIGGKGDDTYVSDSSSDIVSENASEGNDTVQVSVSYTLDLANIENLTLTGSTNIDATGNTENNVITGNAGNNVLDGDVGADTLVGGLGNDDYVVDNTGDVVSELASAGDDYVSSSINYTLANNVETLDLVSGFSTAISATGNSGDNTLLGNEFANVLNGLGGADTLTGGQGDDTYVVDSSADVVNEVAGEGTDTVQSGVNYTLTAANVENVTLTGTAISAKGSSIANIITGTSANNVLDGGAGTDTLIGGAGNDAYIVDSTTDVISDTAGNDTVSSSVTFNIYGSPQKLALENVTLTGSGAISAGGNSLANVLTGNSAANVLDGGAGADTLIGGLGNDTYGVDSTADVVSEAASAGTDVIRSSINYTLTAANVENLSLYVASGTVGLAGTGSSFNNVINGSSNADTLDGGAGTDTLSGGAGNDTYIIDSSTDTISEATGAGTDTIRSSVNYSLVSNVENLVLTGTSALNATGNSVNNNITGNAANNVIDGGLGVDTLAGGAGNDVYIVDNSADIVNEISSGTAGGTDTISSSVNYSLAAVITNGVTLAPANVENLVLTGSAVTGLGNSLANQITGNSANNLLNGGAGADTLIGGSGDDIYVIDSAADVMSELASGGIDTVSSLIGYVLPNISLENLVLTGSVIYGGGNSLDNVITGNSASNLLNGGAGADILVGGLGNDTYVIDQTGDVISEVTGAGNDTVQVSTNYTLSLANIENLTLGGTAISATGNSDNNIITGNASANVIEGGSGLDTLIGGGGSDTYVVDSSTDVISESLSTNAGGGVDTVSSSVNYTLTAANVENVTLTGSTAVNATGNAGDNTLTGNTLANTLTGGDGNDTYVIDGSDKVVEASNAAAGANDTIVSSVSYTLDVANVEGVRLSGTANLNATGSVVDNVLVGNSGNNTLTGLEGNDRLNGGSGVDTLIGGIGNDLYVVDTSTDVISENANQGSDTIRSSINYTLTVANVENLMLDNSNGVAHSATGNSLANILTASLGSTLTDTLVGGDGNDTYVVDSTADIIKENANEGTDTVQSSVSYVLTTATANVENVTLIGSTTINATGDANANTLTGNSLANTLTGNGGNDILTGGLGVDTLAGGAGDDLYILYSTADATDVINEAVNNGTDTIGAYINFALTQQNVENLSLLGTVSVSATGNSTNNLLTGNNIDNVLDGGAGRDTLDGGLGADTLIGGDGADVFKLIGTDADKFDTINDFVKGDDVIGLLKTGFGSDVAGTIAADNVVSANEFLSGAGISAATSATQRLIYNTTDGALYYDADGNGTTATAQQIALVGVSTHPDLAAIDFSILQI